MNIGHFNHHAFPCIGGIENFITNLTVHGRKEKIHHEILAFNKCPTGKRTLPKKDSVQGTRIQRIPFIDLGFYKIAFDIFKHTKRFDVIHIHSIGFLSDALLLGKILGIVKPKLIVSTHGGIFHTKQKSFFKKLYFEYWMKFIFNAVDKVICDSKNDYTLFKKIIPLRKLTLIENAVDVKRFQGNHKKKKNSFVFVGRISKNKRVDLLLKAFQKVKNPFQLKIIGGDFDGLIPDLEEQKKTLGLSTIIFTGKMEENPMIKAIKEAEYFVSASEYEGFGISTIEAMAAGCIPLVQPIDSFKEFVEDKKQGFLVNYRNSEKAAGMIAKTMHLPQATKNKLSTAAKQKTAQYAWDKKIKDYIDIYNEVSV